jgi:hypothetical protein
VPERKILHRCADFFAFKQGFWANLIEAFGDLLMWITVESLVKNSAERKIFFDAELHLISLN